MFKTSFTLIEKNKLTHDVFELVYSLPTLTQELPKAGQYVLFQLAPGLNRAYSLASFTDTTFTLIIKRVAEGKGSTRICDAEIGTVFHGMIPLGHFILRETSRNKCFIGTGTGFAPLYCQLLRSSELTEKPEKIAFIFGVRHLTDTFYVSEITGLRSHFTDCVYRQYLSRETELSSNSIGISQDQGYVLDWITAENIAPYEEFYLCGSPAMVKSAREKLDALGIPKESIFFEQY